MTANSIILTILVAGFTYWLFRTLTRPNQYSPVDLEQIDRDELRKKGQRLLAQSESWPIQLKAEGVSVSSSCEPYVVRAVRYRVECRADFESTVAYVKKLSDCEVPRLEKPGKIEETLYDHNRGQARHEWVRRSVHVSPPPGSNRDAVVFYTEDRPTEDTYTIAFQSVDRMAGQSIEPHEGTSRFQVKPAYYQIQKQGEDRVVVDKIEAVDPCGMVSSWLNNYFISVFFFRKYMFDEAQTMRANLSNPVGEST